MADPTNRNQIGNLTYDVASRRALAASGDTARGKALFQAQSCVACHTDADGQTPKGPHLVDIGKRYKRTTSSSRSCGRAPRSLKGTRHTDFC
jgi:cytochrome c551/c552